MFIFAVTKVLIITVLKQFGTRIFTLHDFRNTSNK